MMEENKNLEIIKPEFNGEITARIKSVGEIESNMKEVKCYVENLNNYYKNVTFTEETMKQAKQEKSNVNKFKKQVLDYRKNIISEYNKPIKIFDDTAKETEKLLVDTYNTINIQVQKYEDIQKKQKEQEVRDYFEEYKQSLNVDFITFENANIKVGLSDSLTSLKKKAKDFIDKVNTDEATIMLQEHKEEILVEYKQNGLNLNNAIITVTNRFKAVEEEKRKQEEFIKEASKAVIVEAKGNLYAPQNKEILVAPVEEKQEEILKLNFTVRATKTKLKLLKEFLENGGYDYE